MPRCPPPLPLSPPPRVGDCGPAAPPLPANPQRSEEAVACPPPPPTTSLLPFALAAPGPNGRFCPGAAGPGRPSVLSVGGGEARSGLAALPYFCRRPPHRPLLPELRPAPYRRASVRAAGRRWPGPEVRCFPPSSGATHVQAFEVGVGGSCVLSCVWGGGRRLWDTFRLNPVPGCTSVRPPRAGCLYMDGAVPCQRRSSGRPAAGCVRTGLGTGHALCYPASVSLRMSGKYGRALLLSLVILHLIIIIKLFAVGTEGNYSRKVDQEKPFWKELGVERDLVCLEATLDLNSVRCSRCRKACCDAHSAAWCHLRVAHVLWLAALYRCANSEFSQSS